MQGYVATLGELEGGVGAMGPGPGSPPRFWYFMFLVLNNKNFEGQMRKLSDKLRKKIVGGEGGIPPPPGKSHSMPLIAAALHLMTFMHPDLIINFSFVFNRRNLRPLKRLFTKFSNFTVDSAETEGN